MLINHSIFKLKTINIRQIFKDPCLTADRFLLLVSLEKFKLKLVTTPCRATILRRLCNLLSYRRNTVYCSTECSPKALHVTYRGRWVTSTRAYLSSLVTPTNTKQNMPFYFEVSLAGWLGSSLSGSFPNWKSWVRIPVKT